MTSESMKLPEGKTCADCVHCRRCCLIFGGRSNSVECDFYPIRFSQKPPQQEQTP